VLRRPSQTYDWTPTSPRDPETFGGLRLCAGPDEATRAILGPSLTSSLGPPLGNGSSALRRARHPISVAPWPMARRTPRRAPPASTLEVPGPPTRKEEDTSRNEVELEARPAPLARHEAACSTESLLFAVCGRALEDPSNRDSRRRLRPTNARGRDARQGNTLARLDGADGGLSPP